MEKTLLVDMNEAGREAGKIALADLGCLVFAFPRQFDARFSANGHKNSGKPFGVALVNLHGYDDSGLIGPAGFAFATTLAAIGVPHIAVVGAERVTDESFHKTLEFFGNKPCRSGQTNILLLYGEKAPVRGNIIDWGAAYQLLMPTALSAAA